MPSEKYADISRQDITEIKNVHLAKLLVMNAKHYLRGNQQRLRIDELYKKAVVHQEQDLTPKEMFSQVYAVIDYTQLEPEFHKRTELLLANVMDK